MHSCVCFYVQDYQIQRISKMCYGIDYDKTHSLPLDYNILNPLNHQSNNYMQSMVEPLLVKIHQQLSFHLKLNSSLFWSIYCKALTSARHILSTWVVALVSPGFPGLNCPLPGVAVDNGHHSWLQASVLGFYRCIYGRNIPLNFFLQNHKLDIEIGYDEKKCQHKNWGKKVILKSKVRNINGK